MRHCEAATAQMTRADRRLINKKGGLSSICTPVRLP